MKNYEVKFTSNADDCLVDIGNYIAIDNPVRAKSYVNELYDSITNTLSVFPFGSSIYDEIETEVEIRRYVYQSYNCYYYFSKESETVSILFIYNSAMEVKQILLESIKKHQLR